MILQVPPWVCCVRGLWGELFFLSTVSLAEAVDLAVGIQLAHFAGPERMAGGRNVETDDGDLLSVNVAHFFRGHGGAGRPLGSGGGIDEDDRVVFGMDLSFHG